MPGLIEINSPAFFLLLFEITEYLHYPYVLKLINMFIRKSKTTLQFILGGILLITVISAGCNNSSEKKEEVKDSTSMKKMTQDTMKRDTMRTRPTVNP